MIPVQLDQKDLRLIIDALSVYSPKTEEDDYGPGKSVTTLWTEHKAQELGMKLGEFLQHEEQETMDNETNVCTREGCETKPIEHRRACQEMHDFVDSLPDKEEE